MESSTLSDTQLKGTLSRAVLASFNNILYKERNGQKLIGLLSRNQGSSAHQSFGLINCTASTVRVIEVNIKKTLSGHDNSENKQL